MIRSIRTMNTMRRGRWLALGVAAVMATGVVAAAAGWAGFLPAAAGLPGTGLPGGMEDFSQARGQLHSGPWGDVRYTRINVAPSLEAAGPLLAEARPQHWTFARTSRQELAALVAALPISNQQMTELLETVRPTPEVSGYTLTPSAEVVAALDPVARQRLYTKLCTNWRNAAQMNAFRFYGDSPEQWLEAVGVPAPERAMIEPLIYRNGHMLFFADASLVLPKLANRQAKLRLVQQLATESTLMLTLHVHEGQDIEGLVKYWGRGGRGFRGFRGRGFRGGRVEDIRTLLQSLADAPGGGSIDIVHLLPPFARERLYTYPVENADLPTGDSRDCHWTALNFFNDTPNDRFANAQNVSAILSERYREVTKPTFGDLVVFSCDGSLFHTAVYIADGVVFTHNGTRFSRPWMLLPLKAMKSFYPHSRPTRMRFLRRIINHRDTEARR